MEKVFFGSCPFKPLVQGPRKGDDIRAPARSQEFPDRGFFVDSRSPQGGCYSSPVARTKIVARTSVRVIDLL